MEIIKLEEYLVDFLKNDQNNGKVISLTGKWGSGKTFFWTNHIKNNLQDQNIIYISLYGKETIKQIEREIYKQIVYKKEEIEKNNFFDKVVNGLNIFKKGSGDFIQILYDDFLELKAKQLLEKKPSLICFDDFERKSSIINLNDLFGFINNLTVELQIKVLIILNSDELLKLDADIFHKTKEKLISKSLLFNPSHEELFVNIYSKYQKYQKIQEYQAEILSLLTKINERNGRTYIKVLDNILEWKEFNKKMDRDIVNSITLATLNFTNFGIVLDYKKNINLPRLNSTGIDIEKYYFIYENFPQEIVCFIEEVFKKSTVHLLDITELIEEIYNKIQYIQKTKEYKDTLLKNSRYLESIYLYGFFYKYDQNLEDSIVSEINAFISTGILIKDI